MKTKIRDQRSEVRGQKTEVRGQRSEVSLSRRLGYAQARERRTGILCTAFTLVELLVVISVIAILLGLIMPTYYSVREKAKYTKAKVTVKNLETAFKAYLDHYRVWPSIFAGDTTTLEIGGAAGSDGEKIFKILRGDTGVTDNPDAIAFYEFESTNSVAGALDPWSEPSDSTTWQRYRVRVDKSYDNIIAVGGVDLYRAVIVWSAGPNGVDDGGTGDDVKSWD